MALEASLGSVSGGGGLGGGGTGGGAVYLSRGHAMELSGVGSASDDDVRRARVELSFSIYNDRWHTCVRKLNLSPSTQPQGPRI